MFVMIDSFFSWLAYCYYHLNYHKNLIKTLRFFFWFFFLTYPSCKDQFLILFSANKSAADDQLSSAVQQRLNCVTEWTRLRPDGDNGAVVPCCVSTDRLHSCRLSKQSYLPATS